MPTTQLFRSKIINALSVTAFSNLVVGFLKLAALLIHVRLVSTLEFGIASLLTLLLVLYISIVRNSFITAVVKKHRITSYNKQLFDNNSIFLSIVFALILFATSEYVGGLFAEANITTELRVASIAIIFIGFYSIPYGLLSRDLEFSKIAEINLIATFFGFFLISIVLTYYDAQGLGIVIGLCAQEFILMLLSRKYLKRENYSLLKPDFSKKFLREFLSNALANSLNFFGTQGEKIILLKYFGLASLGLYGRAYQIISLPSTYFGKAFETVLFPFFANRQRHMADNFLRYIISHLTPLVFLTPAACIIFLYAEDLTTVLLSQNWKGAAPLIQIMSIIGRAR